MGPASRGVQLSPKLYGHSCSEQRQQQTQAQQGAPDPGPLALDGITKRMDWVPFSPQNAWLATSDMYYIRWLVGQDMWAHSAKSWMSSFLLDGHVYKRVSDGKIFRSIGTRAEGTHNHGGALVWWLKPSTLVDSMVLQTLRRDEDLPFAVVTDFDDFLAMPHSVVTPLEHAQALHPARVALRLAQPVCMLRYAAEKAFAGVSASMLYKLAAP